jgi:hypothetical protein
MEFDSIKHLELNPNLFDIDKCYEIYDQGIFNHHNFMLKERNQ